MLEGVYRRRLESDLARWEGAGVIGPDAVAAVRRAAGPVPHGPGIAVMVGVIGGLLIAAAFLAFVAANWSEIPRAARFALLLAGIGVSYALGTLFANQGRTVMADTAAAVGSIVFGAAIALVGQMYHLAGDFAGGLLLWTLGAVAAAALTCSIGALAVALAAGCAWSAAAMSADPDTVHWNALALWIAGTALAVAWRSNPARHLVCVAVLAWWIATEITLTGGRVLYRTPSGDLFCAGAAVMVGVGLLLEGVRDDRLAPFGRTMATYGLFALSAILAFVVAETFRHGSETVTLWVLLLGCAGAGLALLAAAVARSGGMALLGLSAVFAVIGVFGRGDLPGEPWLLYALALGAGLCIVVSGVLDDVRSRIVAGWLGLGLVIAAVTWAVPGTLLTRAFFLACAGGFAIALAIALSRWKPHEAAR